MKPDLTPLYHAVIALAIFALGALVGHHELGAGVGIGVFLGREHAQAEYRWMERYRTNLRGMPWWGGFDPKAWDFASVEDWLLPLMAVGMALLLWK